MENKQGNMYDWAKPWNPLGGECQHKCGYCSSHSFRRYPEFAKKYSGEPRIIEHELKNLGKGKTIFVVAQNDLFASNVPDDMIDRVIRHCVYHSENTYLFQTKNPDRFKSFWIPVNSILCTTIETNRVYRAHMGDTPSPKARAMAMNDLAHDGFKTFVTIEPIMDFDLEEMVYLIETCLPEQVNIGADSKNHHLPEPSKDKLLALIDELKKFTTIARKTNLERLLK